MTYGTVVPLCAYDHQGRGGSESAARGHRRFFLVWNPSKTLRQNYVVSTKIYYYTGI